VPRLALPRLPLPMPCPGPRGTSTGATGRSAAMFPALSGQGQARRAFIRNGKGPGQTGTRPVPGPLPAGVCPPTATPRWSAAPPPSQCVASKASGRGLLLPLP